MCKTLKKSYQAAQRPLSGKQCCRKARPAASHMAVGILCVNGYHSDPSSMLQPFWPMDCTCLFMTLVEWVLCTAFLRTLPCALVRPHRPELEEIGPASRMLPAGYDRPGAIKAMTHSSFVDMQISVNPVCLGEQEAPLFGTYHRQRSMQH